MTDAYDLGAGDAAQAPTGASGRPVSREPFMGPRIRNRRTGEVRYWNGSRYVSPDSPDRLPDIDRQALDTARQEVTRYQSFMPDLERFEQLNRTVPTGSLSQRLGMWANNAPRILSLDNPMTPQNEPQGYDEMRAITSRHTPSQREPGSGSSSNLDVLMFREGLPNVGYSGPANSRIIDQYRRDQQRARDWQEFLEWRLQQSGNFTGATEEFGRYQEARRRDPRLTWRSYFRADQAQHPPQSAGPGAGRAPAAGAQTDARRAQIEQRLRELDDIERGLRR